MIIRAIKPLRRAAAHSLVAGAIAMLLAGCSYRMDRVENPVKMPVAWDAPSTPDAVPGIPREWWKNFNSPVLNGLIEEAFKSNPNIIGTELRLVQAERSLSQSRDGLFPDLSASASTSRGRSGGNQRDESNTASTSLSMSTSYSVDLWGATAARYRQSVASFIGTKWDADLARINLASQVSRAYFQLLSNQSNLAVAQQNLETAERLLRITEARAREGVLREFDLTQQRIQMQQTRTSLISAENSVRQSETALGLLLGVTPQDFHIEGEPIAQLTVPEIEPWLPSEMLLRRPDIASAETDMVSAKANLIIARASLIPVSLSLSANTSTSSQDLLTLTDTRNFSIQGALSIATGIFNYRGRRNSYLNAESNEYLALINYAQTIRTALKEVDDNLAATDAALRTEESQRLTLQQSERSLELAELQFREGTSDQEDLLNAQRSVFQAQESLQRQRLTRLNAAVALYVALGGGWEGPTEEDLARMQAKK